MDKTLNFLSYNVNGLNGPIKRKRILTQMKKLEVDIAFLQETHLTEKEHQKLKRDWVGSMVASSFNSKARGVAILFKKTLPIKIQNIVSDPVGRFIMVHCQIFSELWTLMNIYAPNTDDEKFVQDTFLNLAEAHENILIGGDFNFCLDPVMDRSSRTMTRTRAVKITLNLMEDLNLIDVWRKSHPRERDYSFYSNRHDTYSRIDLFLISAQLRGRITQIDYKARLLSDHSPLLMTIMMPDKEQSVYRWRLNSSLLKRQDFCDFIRKQIRLYLETNLNSVEDKFIVWDAMKAYLRGQIISYSSKIKKEYMRESERLEKEITVLEKDLQKVSSDTKKIQLANKKFQYNTLQTYRTEKLILRTNQRYYELGERAQKVLAWQLKEEQISRTINSIRTDQNIITYKPREINEVFKQFYTNLYHSESEKDEIKINNFLSKIQLPTISNEEQMGLNASFTLREVEEVLHSLQSNKSPGEDGFPPEFYKKFKDLLLPVFMEVLHQAERTSTLPDSFSMAIITVIPKKGKDPLKASSYRPISLLNADYKIVAKLLARRLAEFLPKLVREDQTGFVKKRRLSDNVARFISILHLAQKRKELSVAVALDAEKAFDRLEWDFLFKVLEKYGLGNGFINWVKALYKQPKAKVVTNGQSSQSFNLERSSRQGCPLSPALFVLAIEPLAELIRSDLDIEGFKVNQENHKINLFADDVLIYLTRPLESLRKLYFRLEEYGKVSGYKINKDKTEIMPLFEGNYDQCKRESQFKWQKEGIKYLGVKVDNKLNNLYKLNYKPLIKKIDEDLKKWMNLPITLLGRVNCIKMNIFPRIQYLFQTLPILLPKEFFQELNKIVRNFLWKGKMPRVSMEKLTWKFELGGLQLPNFKNYYLAAQMSFISSFYQEGEKTSWVRIEMDKIKEVCPEEFIYKWEAKLLVKDKESPLLKQLINIWLKTVKVNDKRFFLTAKTPLVKNRLLPFAWNNQILQVWEQKGIKHIGDCYEGNNFLTFSQLRNKYQIPGNSLFFYYQLQSFLREKLGNSMLLFQIKGIEFLIQGRGIKKFISSMYKLLQKSSPKIGIQKSRQRWETDLNISIDEPSWERLCLDSMKNTINVRYSLVQYNFLHQLYLTPKKLNNLKPSLSENCFRCNQDVGTFLHSTWACPKVTPFWKELKKNLEQLLNRTIPLDSRLFLLGDIKGILPRLILDKYQERFLKIAIAIARKCVAVTWKDHNEIRIERWYTEMRSCIPLEKVTYNLRDRYDFFLKVWNPFILKLGLKIGNI